MIDLEEEARDAFRPDHQAPPRGRDVVAAILVFVALPAVAALVTVGAYVSAVAR